MDYELIDNNSENIIFFLHGWGGDKNSFSWIKNHITNCSMIFVSFTGFGNSPPPDKPYFVYDYMLEIKDLITQIARGKKVSIVCHSFGCRVAVKLCANFPELVDKLFIVDGAGLKPHRKINYYINVIKYKRLKKQVNKGKKNPSCLSKYGSKDYKVLNNIMKATFINVVNEDLKRCFKLVKAKTFIFWGEKDYDTPLYMAKKINKFIKNSKMFVLKDAGHFSYLDNVDVFIDYLTSFLFN